MPKLDDIAVPGRIQALPLDPIRKVPVPWFVQWLDGKPEFRVADYKKLPLAIKERRCWVCGEVLGRNMSFVLGPMCGLNRTSAEPPCHTGCARYSAVHCPFLSRPRMERREGGLDQLDTGCSGHMIRRNPGVTLLWTTRAYSLFRDDKGGVLFDVGEPQEVEWFAEGRPATRDEVAESVRTGLPILEEMARQEAGAMNELRARRRALEKLYPKA